MLFFATILNLISSYLIASIAGSFLVIYIAFFAFVVLDIEILSLFCAIDTIPVVFITVLNLIFSIVIFKYKKAKPIKPDFDFRRLKNAFLLDKGLIILLTGWFVFVLSALFLAYVMPPLEPDSQTYHYIRAFMFSKNHTLLHYDTNDIRAIIMPINSEILYAWAYTLSKKIYGCCLFSYVSYLTAICAIWAVGNWFRFPFRKILFVIFIFSSLPCIIAQSVSLQTDIIVGVLFLIAFYLYMRDKIYFSALSIALAMGVKSTAMMMLFGFFIFIFLYDKLIEKRQTRILKFFGLTVLNFLIFSSYNYILNFLQFQNPITNKAALLGHGFWGGFRGYVANLVNFSFQMIDSTGFKWGYYLNNLILLLKVYFLSILHIEPFLGTNVSLYAVNIAADEQYVGYGMLGILVLIPSLIKVFLTKTKNNKKRLYILLCAIVLILNVLVLARAMAYMMYSIRFTVSFVILSVFVLSVLYKKRGFYRGIIIFFALFYMTVISLHILRAPFFKVYGNLKKNNFNMEKFIQDGFEGRIINISPFAYEIKKTLDTKYKDAKKIAIFKKLDSVIFYLKTLPDREVDFLTSSKMDEYNLNQYDLVIVEQRLQTDNIFNSKDVKINYTSKGDSITFDNSDSIKCFYTKLEKDAMSEGGGDIVTQNADMATKRACLGYNRMIQNPNFKFDMTHNANPQEDTPLYYFIKSN